MSSTPDPGGDPGTVDPEKRAGIYRATYESFPAFADVVFSESFENFVRGEWIARRCRHLQEHDKTVNVGPRDHFKSTGNYAYVAWQVWRNRFNSDPDVEWADGPTDLEILYFSFNQPMARYHIGSENKDGIKKLIDRNPWFEPVADQKKRADSRAEYSWNDHGTVSLSPASVQQMVRGRHTDIVIVDDPFQDDNKQDAGLDPGLVLKINRIFKDAIMDIPTGPMAELHVTTTPQTEEDFTFDDQLLADFGRIEEPAIQDYDREEVLWPEWKSYEDLISTKEKRGRKSFNQEYQITPRSSEVGFFKDEEVAAMTVQALEDYGERDLEDRWVAQEEEWEINGCIAGLDIGKKRHPAHLAVFAAVDRIIQVDDDVTLRSPTGHLFQVHSKWMDGWDYKRQVEYCKRAIDYFQIQRLPYDNTRGEYEALEEMGMVPPEMKPVSLSGGTNREVASSMDVYATTDRIKLLPDGRQNRQLKVVTSDLEAVETGEGHGESFWSIGLACYAGSRITRQLSTVEGRDEDSGVSYV
ncbi:hypothetical protein [Natronobacterium gregoryi]|uniref:Terminase n=2 Tax=Natronobacterium gregoryi TaxID=44930 RepID=L0AKX4_NATGS|nr:hypothetical protein [Natronobacterium gregoryi]AFZ74548.1 hypothetical protein Natgr_3429 [Natronobacterium gregoryi SP2]ELY72381.1 hypothetical protein C490_03518 [Natronobacterium gregoryi SP2]PLK21709.1 hypothetical protein CYV19_02410 [Natronobacterium gregoryi SP2]SFI96484.1 hypothetical protein SAMN05443661_110157 [Natronobacterium gregoryi]